MRRFLRLISPLVILAISLVALFPGTASAHERRTVAEKYQFVVGFLTEPPFVNEINGIDVRVTIPGENNKPVEGLQSTLKAEVIVGGGARTMPIELATRFGMPGAYAGHFMPTREGSYIFRFTGTIEGKAIEERFESGPGRFNDVQSVQALQFPEKVPDPVAAGNELRAARDEAALARTLAIVGVVVGIAGLAIGAMALQASRRAPVATRPPRG